MFIRDRVYAAKIMAVAGLKILEDPSIAEKAKAERELTQARHQDQRLKNRIAYYTEGDLSLIHI